MSQTVDIRSRRTGNGQGSGDSRVPPHNLQAEESLLGAMLLSQEAIVPAVEICSVADFYKPAHGHIFDAILSLWGRGEPADPVTVGDELSRADLLESIGGPSTLVSLQANTPATSNAARYARIVEEHALLRRLIEVAGEVAEMGYSIPDDVVATVDQAEAMMFEVAQRRQTDTLVPIRKLLSESLDTLERLYDRGESITGVPTGFTDLDEQLSGLQPNALLIVGARPAMGKCVAWDTTIVDPHTGERHTAAELHRRGRSGELVDVFSFDETSRELCVTQPSAFIDDGTKPLFSVRTSLGRHIRTTLTHPFLTPSGWKQLGELRVGDRVGVPSVLPVFGIDSQPDSEMAVLAYLLAARVHTSPIPVVELNGADVVDDLALHAHRLGTRAMRHSLGDGRWRVVFAGNHDATNPVEELLRRHGLLTCAAKAREIPALVYRLPKDQMAAFVNRLMTAGCNTIIDLDKAGELRWQSPSERLCHDLQHLLLRFGINAAVQSNPAGHALVISAAEDLRLYAKEIGLVGREAEMALMVQAMDSESAQLVGANAGSTSTRVFGPTPVWETAEAFLAGSNESERDPGTELRWDEIVAIDFDGHEQVYDLTVPVHHNFVAGDVLVHNTAFALNIASHAALSGTPTLYFSLEMSHSEITQRLLCAEARVDASRLRNGRLHDTDWAKINQGIGRLAEAPMFIDDNPNLTVMDIRAKARRLKASPSGLGLVIIDYLQLMSGRSNAENRQVEVSEMSRGLKILARELQVPVMALSQLSRNLEMRADKRPILADLRESGSLEQDADVVMFLYRDEVYNHESPEKGTAEVIVSKHRNGPVGTAQLAFIDRYTRFANMARS